MKLTISHLATSLFALVVLGGAAHQSLAASDADADQVEKMCRPQFNPGADVTPAVCTYTIVKGTGTGAGGNGCATGWWRVTASSCSSQVEKRCCSTATQSQRVSRRSRSLIVADSILPALSK